MIRLHYLEMKLDPENPEHFVGLAKFTDEDQRKFAFPFVISVELIDGPDSKLIELLFRMGEDELRELENRRIEMSNFDRPLSLYGATFSKDNEAFVPVKKCSHCGKLNREFANPKCPGCGAIRYELIRMDLNQMDVRKDAW